MWCSKESMYENGTNWAFINELMKQNYLSFLKTILETVGIDLGNSNNSKNIGTFFCPITMCYTMEQYSLFINYYRDNNSFKDIKTPDGLINEIWQCIYDMEESISYHYILDTLLDLFPKEDVLEDTQAHIRFMTILKNGSTLMQSLSMEEHIGRIKKILNL